MSYPGRSQPTGDDSGLAQLDTEGTTSPTESLGVAESSKSRPPTRKRAASISAGDRSGTGALPITKNGAPRLPGSPSSSVGSSFRRMRALTVSKAFSRNIFHQNGSLFGVGWRRVGVRGGGSCCGGGLDEHRVSSCFGVFPLDCACPLNFLPLSFFFFACRPDGHSAKDRDQRGRLAASGLIRARHLAVLPPLPGGCSLSYSLPHRGSVSRHNRVARGD